MVSLFIAGDVISPLTWLLFHGYHYIIANSTEDPYELFQEIGDMGLVAEQLSKEI